MMADRCATGTPFVSTVTPAPSFTKGEPSVDSGQIGSTLIVIGARSSQSPGRLHPVAQSRYRPATMSGGIWTENRYGVVLSISNVLSSRSPWSHRLAYLIPVRTLRTSFSPGRTIEVLAGSTISNAD